MTSLFSNQELTRNDKLKLDLARYVAAYIQEELDRGLDPREIDVFLVEESFDAFLGGAR
jgi:hypothetical protein